MLIDKIDTHDCIKFLKEKIKKLENEKFILLEEKKLTKEV